MIVGVLYATLGEAAPFLARAQASPLRDERFPCHHFTMGNEMEGIVLICGMGKEKARQGTETLYREHRVVCIVNPGISGALRTGIAPGEIFAVSRVRDGDDPEKGVWSSTLLESVDLPVATLVTFEKPVFDQEKKQQAARYGDLVDMEGVAVVRACLDLGVSSYLIKGVSDFADDGGREMLKKNLAAVSGDVARQVERSLRSLVVDEGLDENAEQGG